MKGIFLHLVNQNSLLNDLFTHLLYDKAYVENSESLKA